MPRYDVCQAQEVVHSYQTTSNSSLERQSWKFTKGSPYNTLGRQVMQGTLSPFYKKGLRLRGRKFFTSLALSQYKTPGLVAVNQMPGSLPISL